jgi:dihydropteroate synthase
MEAEGADLIDVGGESTRPGSDPVSADEELRRVVPVLEGLEHRLRIPISIDTSKAPVARTAIEAGAALINDVTGLAGDRDLAGVAAVAGASLVLMHMRGSPRAMYADAAYDDQMGEISRELGESIARAERAGVSRQRIIVDPGIGFAKRPSHSYGVLARLPALATGVNLPVLVGPSRKSFMRDALGSRPAIQRDWGTAAAVTAAVLAGAHIVRVHAVAEMIQVVRVADEIRRHAVDERG